MIKPFFRYPHPDFFSVIGGEYSEKLGIYTIQIDNMIIYK